MAHGCDRLGVAGRAWFFAGVLSGVAPRTADLAYSVFVNYTTLGDGEKPVKEWRLLGPITAMNGALMFGWSTAVLFEVLFKAMELAAIVVSISLADRVRPAVPVPQHDLPLGLPRKSSIPLLVKVRECARHGFERQAEIIGDIAAGSEARLRRQRSAGDPSRAGRRPRARARFCVPAATYGPRRAADWSWSC